MKRMSILLPLAAVLLVLAATDNAAGQTALAMRLEDIDIDGDLGDWPRGMPEYPIRSNARAYGGTDLDGTDLNSSRDLSPSFRIGYDPDEALLYLAVKARDDELVVGRGSEDTDACEVYVSGRGSTPVLQYALVPGGGQYDPDSRDNPVMLRDSIGRTGTRAAYQRHGDYTTYEWAIDVSRRTAAWLPELSTGMTIGFDVVVVDRDRQGNTAWIAWGPPQRDKYTDAARLGKLAFSRVDAEDAAELAEGIDEALSEAAEALSEVFEESPELAIEASALATEIQALVAEATALATEGAAQAVEAHAEKMEAHARKAEQHARAAERRAQIVDGSSPRIVIDGIDVPMPPMLPHVLAVPSVAAMVNPIVELVVSILGAIFIILAIGLTIFIIRRGGRSKTADHDLEEMTDRLEAIERRLTDTQDVMIALSEKYDRLDDGKRE